MRPDRHLLRAAVRLREVYVSRAAQAVEQALLQRLGGYRQALERTQAVLRQAAAEGWPEAASRVRRGLRGLSSAVRDAVSATDLQLQQPQPAAPRLGDLAAELAQLDDEFGDLKIDLRQKTVRVTTEPIELEEVFLGPFALQLRWQRLEREAGGRCFEVLALDPRPAATKSEVTHPHVSGGSLCPGDAAQALQRALEQGRLADAFCLVRGVLTHYNPSSAHVPLSDWGSRDCHECGGHVHSDDLSWCAYCGFDYCADCAGNCVVCGDQRCHGCLHRCASCRQWCCAGCQARSAHSARVCCKGCVSACSACAAVTARDELDAGTSRCTPCRAVAAAQPTPPAPARNPAPDSEPPLTETDDEPATAVPAGA